MESRPNSPLSLFDDVADLDLEDGTEDDDLLPAFAVAEREVAKEAHDAAPPRVILSKEHSISERRNLSDAAADAGDRGAD